MLLGVIIAEDTSYRKEWNMMNECTNTAAINVQGIDFQLDLNSFKIFYI